jgi:hypothetical protein
MMLEALGKLGAHQDLPPMPPLVERRFIIAAVEGRAPSASKRHLRWQPRLAFAMSLSSAVVLSTVLLWLSLSPTTKESATQAQMASIELPTEVDHAEPTLLSDGRSMVPVNSNTVIWLSQDAHIEWVKNSQTHVVVRVLEGRALVEIEGAPRGYRFAFETRDGQAEAKGTVYSVTVPKQGKCVARVLRGVVEVTGIAAQGEAPPSYLLREGEEGRLGEGSPSAASFEDLELDRCLLARCKKASPELPQSALTPPPLPAQRSHPTARGQKAAQSGRRGADEEVEAPQPSSPPIGKESDADALLALAREQRRAGLFPMAAGTYQRLIDERHSSDTAKGALVSLAQLELVELDDPVSALSHFRQYLNLSPGGYLTEEALLGVVKTLTELGRNENVVTAATSYLSAYPGGYGAAEVLRLRAEARSRLGQCDSAKADLERLRALWPGSPLSTATRLPGPCSQ